jgi:hypothetical protein
VNSRSAILFMISVVFWLPLQPAHADIYQYTDESGVIHFTNVSGGKNHKRVRSEPENIPASKPSTRAPSSPSVITSSASMPSVYLDIINLACDRYGVDPLLVHAIVKVESDFNPYALSRKGAMGLMQLMPQTAVEMNVKNSFSPHENINGGVRYLRYLIDRYEGNLSLALAAYNAGESSVKRWGTVPPFKETKHYVDRILKIYNGTGKTFTPRYTIYIGYSEDGSLMLTDNPHNHQNKSLKRKTVNDL